MAARTHARKFAAIVTFAVTLSFLSTPALARLPVRILLSVPIQGVDHVIDGNGKDVGPGLFEAEVRGYENGSAKGQAMLRLDDIRYDFSVQQFELRYGDIISDTISANLSGRLQRTDASGKKTTSTFTATVQPSYGDPNLDTPDCLIWDVGGAGVTDREPLRLHFEVEGTLEDTRRVR
jgi:hypothetical protein